VVRERAAVTIEVRDDGRGIDRTRVLEKAREMGLVTDATTRLADDDIVRLIARPGFSTADTVTPLSGRGVGIDVVVTRVRALGGSVEIRSIEGQGTTVTVRLPVTLAIVRALLARVDHEIYAVPMTHVRETLEVEAGALRRLQGRDVLLLRSDVVPVVRFRELVKLDPSPRGTTQVIVLALGERRAGLVVDELTGQQDIVVKQFDAVRDGVSVFSGATILADGAPALIVDVGSIL
jgi:two-component system chemotaxis sensor kinase CheA